MKHVAQSHDGKEMLSAKVKDLANITQFIRGFEGLVLPVILCFFTGRTPEHASPMPRNPTPRTGMKFGEDFGAVLLDALSCNHAVHDGAIMLGRPDVRKEYTVFGWSYRLHPPSISSNIENRGSAFNSCLAMSCTTGVDTLLLISREGGVQFCDGKIVHLTI